MEKRTEFVRIFEEENLNIREAAHHLRVNYSTAKYIIKTFRRTGQIETKRMLQ